MKRILLLLSLFLFVGATLLIAADVPTMNKDELKAQLDSKQLVLLDVRSGRDWSSSEFKIQGAIRASGNKIAEWSKHYAKDQTLLLYCA